MTGRNGRFVSLNLNRRHLSESQRAMVAANLANLSNGQRSDYQAAQICAPVTQDDAAEMLQVSRRSVQTAAKVERTAPAEVVEAVKAGNISLNMAALYITKKPNNLTRYYFCSSFKQYCISVQL